MTDIEKFDSAEADRVMELLRAHLAAQDTGELAPSEPDNQENNTENELIVDEPEVAVTEPGEVADEPAAVPKELEMIPEEPELIVDEPEAMPVEPEIVPEVPELIAEVPEAELEVVAEEVDNQENEPRNDATEPEIEDAKPEAAPEEPTAQKPRARKKRRRVPKLEEIEKQAPTPLDAAAREAIRQRAAALAREQESDLFWQRTAAQRAPVAPKAPEAAPTEAPVPPVAAATPSEEVFEPTIASRRKGIREAKEAAAQKEQELLAGVTVEGLLSDIFGDVAAPGGRTWIDTPTAPEEPIEQVSEPTVATPETTPEGESPTLELDGYRVLMPEDAAPAKRGRGEGFKLFSAFSVKRQREGALPKPSIARPSAEQIAFKHKMEESEADFQLLIDLDYENELGEAIGFEKILDYHERRINGVGVHRTGKRSRRERQKQEYTSHGQDIGLSKMYARQRRRHVTRLALTCLLMLTLFVYERADAVLSLFGEAQNGARYPMLYVAVGLLLFLGGVLLLWRNLASGLTGLFRLAPTDYSVCSVGVLATLVYHGVLLLSPAESGLSLYLSPAMGSLCLLALSDLFNWYREFSAFRVVSSKRQKYALLPRVSVGNREGNAQLRLFQNERNERVLYARPVGFVRNYFANTEKKTDHQSAFGAGLLLVTALSCAVALFVFALRQNVGLAFHSAFVAFLLATPVISVLGTSLPMFFATCLRLGKHAAIVGEGPIYEDGTNTTVVIPDNDCFKEMPHEQFELVKNCDAERATILIRALLEKIGSPLIDTVHVPKERRITPDVVTITDIDEAGVAAVVSGDRKTPILFGSVEYLQKYGIRVSPKKDGKYENLFRNMLCVAINNRLTALFIARYRAKDGMSALCEELGSEGLGVKIRSKDPGVTDEMLAELFADHAAVPRVMKPQVAESDIATDRVDATVVALGSPREAAGVLAVCRRIRRAIKIGTLWQFTSIFCGAILSGALVLFDRMSALPPYAVALYTFLFSGAHALTAYLIMRNKDETT